MAVEVWFRNPHDYIRELVEVGECWITWDRGLLHKRKIDPIKFSELHLGPSFPNQRIILVGTQGSAEYRLGSTIDKPVAVYPTWSYGEPSVLLEEMLDHPFGEDAEACTDMTVRDDERPVWGQEHRVIITDLPDMKSGIGRQFLRYLKTLQEDHPDAIIHAHGMYGWKSCFGMGLRAADVEPRTAAQKGNVHTPSGSIEKFERLVSNPQWARALGFSPNELSIPRNRCIYNIRSAVWAGANYAEMFAFRYAGSRASDVSSPDDQFVRQTTASPLPRGAKPQPGDMIACNECSLADKCKYVREDAVCSLPGSETVKMVDQFNTRDADTIIESLGKIVQRGAARMEIGLQNEEIDGEFDPEVSKMMNQVFTQGVALAKLKEPSRFAAGGSKVQVNVGTGVTASIAGATPAQFVAGIFAQLEAKGIPRESITPEMVRGVMEGMNSPEAAPKAITGTVIASE